MPEGARRDIALRDLRRQDVDEEPTGMYLWRVSQRDARLAGNRRHPAQRAPVCEAGQPLQSAGQLVARPMQAYPLRGHFLRLVYPAAHTPHAGRSLQRPGEGERPHQAAESRWQAASPDEGQPSAISPPQKERNSDSGGKTQPGCSAGHAQYHPKAGGIEVILMT